MSHTTTTVMILTEQANELGYDSFEEAVADGYGVVYSANSKPYLTK